MTDITDKIAALPQMPGKDDWHETAATGHKLRSERLQAERDLALEVLRKLADQPSHLSLKEQERTGIECPACRAIADARAVLAACGKGEG